MKKNVFCVIILIILSAATTTIAAQRTIECFDKNWKFAFGNAADPAKDFGCGTEYFNYLTKANSIHNTGPYSNKFDDKDWQDIDLPHDFVVRLPFHKDASHSHGYKTVGYEYPETSVGWYRKTFFVDSLDAGKHIEILFDGIFRDSRVWLNGFYCGGEDCGYLSQNYDITDYINFGGENIVCVRADATLEEGWFYEGGGIYRHVWLTKTEPLHIAQDGIFVSTEIRNGDYSKAYITMSADVTNHSHNSDSYSIAYVITDTEGRTVAEHHCGTKHTAEQKTSCSASACQQIAPMQTIEQSFRHTVEIANPMLWSPEQPYLYTLTACIKKDGKVIDAESVKFGVREVVFDKDRGLILNGKSIKLKGVNMHQDHAGVGAAIPDALLEYRIRQLKKMGCNAYRASHNPTTKAMLNVCDSLGMLVIEENRLTGISQYQIDMLKQTIRRARNHPSIILWSVGNEEWGIEWDKKGEKIAATMRDYCHLFDPTREMTFATSGGPTVEVPVDVASYNYVIQNPIDEHRHKYPERKCLGSEETTGCGTRGVYFDDPQGRWMASLNRKTDERADMYNRIERGWKFYAERPWAAGCFFWTGFDYRGEPNPLSFPATGSEFGLLDYCGFPKDEAYYLKSWWTDETILHILPHWNLKGHEGDTISVWAYSNCHEVELFLNGKSLGRKNMPVNGHLEWAAVYQPGKLRAVGYRNGKRVKDVTIETTGETAAVTAEVSRTTLKADGADLAVIDLTLRDRKGRFVADACNSLTVTIDGEARILGYGNGDPAYQDKEQPADRNARTINIKAFNGHAQLLIQAAENAGTATITIDPQTSEKKKKTAIITLNIK